MTSRTTAIHPSPKTDERVKQSHSEHRAPKHSSTPHSSEDSAGRHVQKGLCSPAPKARRYGGQYWCIIQPDHLHSWKRGMPSAHISTLNSTKTVVTISSPVYPHHHDTTTTTTTTAAAAPTTTTTTTTTILLLPTTTSIRTCTTAQHWRVAESNCDNTPTMQFDTTQHCCQQRYRPRRSIHDHT